MVRPSGYHYENFEKVHFSEVADFIIVGSFNGIYYMNEKGIVKPVGKKKFTLKEFGSIQFYIKKERYL